MIKTPLSTVIGGAGIWTPGCTVLGSMQKTLDQLIKSLFANGEQGFAYDPNDLTTMYQDAAGTVPVTGAGQPVGLILDKSGRGNHATQTNSTSRPILRQNAITGAYYLEFDGSDDFLVTNNIDFTSTDKVSLFAGVRKLSDVAARVVAELSADIVLNNGTFSFRAPRTASSNFGWFSKGTVIADNAGLVTFPAPYSAVFAGFGDISRGTANANVNGILYTKASDQGTGNYGNFPLFIGRRGGASAPFNGHIYSLIGVGRLTSDDETTAIEKELAKRTGVALSV